MEVALSARFDHTAVEMTVSARVDHTAVEMTLSARFGRTTVEMALSVVLYLVIQIWMFTSCVRFGYTVIMIVGVTVV